jgi:hypothetical protein
MVDGSTVVWGMGVDVGVKVGMVVGRMGVGGNSVGEATAGGEAVQAARMMRASMERIFRRCGYFLEREERL